MNTVVSVLEVNYESQNPGHLYIITAVYTPPYQLPLVRLDHLPQARKMGECQHAKVT